jgi:hypothetical protein
VWKSLIRFLATTTGIVLDFGPGFRSFATINCPLLCQSWKIALSLGIDGARIARVNQDSRAGIMCFGGAVAYPASGCWDCVDSTPPSVRMLKGVSTTGGDRIGDRRRVNVDPVKCRSGEALQDPMQSPIVKYPISGQTRRGKAAILLVQYLAHKPTGLLGCCGAIVHM